MKQLEQNMSRLQDQITRKLYLMEQLDIWNTQIAALTPQVRELQLIMNAEQDDVDRLEKTNLGSIVHKLMGTMEEKLSKEQQEADEAVLNFSYASKNLDRLQTLVQDAEIELETLKNCREEYLETLQKRMELVEEVALQMTEQPEAAGKLLQLERRRRSIREALLLCQLLTHAARRTRGALTAAPMLDIPAFSERAAAVAVSEAENSMELATKLQAKLAQMGIDPRDHLLVGPYFRSPGIYLYHSAGETASRLDDAEKQIDLLLTDTTEIRAKLTEALTIVENSLDEIQ